MSSGKKQATTTSISNSEPPKWAIPYYQSTLEQAKGLVNEPYQAYGGERVANAGVMNPFASNEFSDAMVAQSGQDISQNYMNAVQPGLMAQFNSSGAFGGSAHQQSLQGAQGQLGRSLANSANDIRYRQADAARGEWTQANTRLQGAYDADYDMYKDQRDFQAGRFGLLTNALNTIQGGSQSQSNTGANPNYRSAGQNAATAAALIGSYYGGGN